MNVVPELSLSFKELNTLEELLYRVDQKLIKVATNTYEEIAYGIKGSNCNSEDILTYRDIIVQKMNGCGCYNKYTISQLSSKIKTLTA